MDGPTPREYAFAGAALLLVALNLAREGAVDTPTPFVWRAPGFPLGNLYFAYWHARATALFTRRDFVWQPDRSRNPVVAGLRTRVPSHDIDSALQRKYEFAMRADPSRGLVCQPGQNCYGHISEFAPWRLILPIMAIETRAIARALSAEHAGAPPLAGTATAYVRCDSFILEHHDDYGVVPHAFYLDPVRRDPKLRHFVIVTGGRADVSDSPLCAAMVDDLLRAARELDLSSVSIHQRRSVEADWLFLSSVDLLVCGHSTFCASAAFANERAASIAVHEAGAIRPTSELLDDDSADALSVRLVRSPLLGGRTMAGMGWPGVQRFLNGVT
jgi:hypothetical protein